MSVLPWTSFLGPGSTAANNGYMSVPTNSYNNNSQNGSDVRLISSTPSMTDSRQGSTFWIDRKFIFKIDRFFRDRKSIFKKSTISRKNDILIIDRFFEIFCRILKGKNFHRLWNGQHWFCYLLLIYWIIWIDSQLLVYYLPFNKSLILDRQKQRYFKQFFWSATWLYHQLLDI